MTGTIRSSCENIILIQDNIETSQEAIKKLVAHKIVNGCNDSIDKVIISYIKRISNK